MARPSFLLHCVCIPAIFTSQLAAQSGPASLDSLRAEVRRADSSANPVAAVEQRLRLAPYTGTTEARILLQQALVIADSLDRPDLGATAHRLMAAQYAGGGSFRAAYAELAAADSLERLNNLREWTRWEQVQAAEQGRMMAERDSLAQAAADRDRRMAQAMYELQQRTDAWMYGAWAAMAIGLFLLVGLLYRHGSITGRLRATIAELRADVDALKTRAARATQAPQPGPQPEAPPVADALNLADAGMQAMAAGKFRQDGPERLATLLDARQRGDHDKVLRVVASLKPQLLGFDAERCAPLIARLRIPGAAGDRLQWNADLDALEAAVRDLLK